MQATTTSSHNFRTRKKKVNDSYILHILNTYCIKSTKQGIHADTLYFHLPVHKKRRNNISPKMKKIPLNIRSAWQTHDDVRRLPDEELPYD